MRKLVVLLTLLAGSAGAEEAAPKPWVKAARLSEGLHELETSLGGPFSSKVLALVGPDGVLLVDSGYEQTSGLLREALSRLSPAPVRWVVDTHLHDDHVGGQAALSEGALVVAHENVRRRLTSGLNRLREQKASALPALTFDRELTLHVGGEEVRLRHLPAAHTDGDVVVHFVRAGVVAVGDLVFSDRFPYVDLGNGGTVPGLLDALEVLVSDYPEGTRFVASHGRVYGASDLRAWRGELLRMRDEVRSALAAGKTVEQLRAGRALARWEGWAMGFVTADRFLDTLAAPPSPGGGPPSALDRLVTVLLTGDGAAAVAAWRELEASQPGKWSLREEDVNQLGYVLLGRGRARDAVAVLRLNVERFPRSSNAYDSLGEAYLTAGEEALAAENYRKSLELDPSNANAVQMLERLRR